MMRFLAMLLLVVLTGCKALGLDYFRPQPKLPATYSEKNESQAQAQIMRAWWAHFNDTKLSELVDSALKNNPNVQLATARIAEADAYLRETGSYLLPEVYLSADTTRSKVTELGAFPVFVSPIRNNYQLGLDTSYEIDFWGELKRNKEAAFANAQAARQAKEVTDLTLVGLVTGNYLQIRGLDAQITLTEQNIASRKHSLVLTQRRLAGGVASALEVSQAETAYSNLMAQQIELKRLRGIALHQLAILTGVLDLQLDAVDIRQLPLPPEPPSGLPSDLLENRPDIRQAEQQLVAQNAKIGVAKAALYPNITLTGQYGFESLKLRDLMKSGARIWTLGLGLDLPIFDYGRRKARVEGAEAREKQALAQYQIAIQNAFKEVNDALITRRLNLEREQVLQQSERSAKVALTVAENRYKSGYSSYLEVLDAQRVYHEAALNAVQARQGSLLASVELFKALGGDWRPAEPVKLSVPEVQP